MASLRKSKLSPYWQAVLTLPNGTRTNRSTRQTVKKKAAKVAEQMDRTIKAAREGTLSREKLLRTFNDLMSQVGFGSQPSLTNTPSRRARAQKVENDLLAELRRRLGRAK